MAKQVLVSGIQPTGRLHIGNYLGALKNFVELQNSGKYQCYFFIADLHALTENQAPKELEKNIINLAADFLAAGLDPEKSMIFLQSQIPAHTELYWILNAIAPVGELERMTQYKEKSKQQIENINAGLLTYPVLMATDILLYDADTVPVGDDQDQHLELTRTLARKFNSRFGVTFKEPKSLHTNAPRVMSLTSPEKKMSKSEPNGCLFIDDSPEEIKKKLARAVTDSGNEIKYNPEKKSGMSNLLTIFSGITEKKIEAIEKEYHGKTYATLKSDLADTIADSLEDYRKKKKSLLAKPQVLMAALKSGSSAAAKVAEEKMKEVREKVGIDPQKLKL